MSPSPLRPIITSENGTASGWNYFLTCLQQHSNTCFTGTSVIIQSVFYHKLFLKHQLLTIM